VQLSASAIVRAATSKRCYHCGWQALGCLHFDPDDARRQAWNGKWPGEDDCERLDFFVNGDADFPDLNRLFTDCVGMPTPDVGSGSSKRRHVAETITIHARSRADAHTAT
jgi:hypothetical protein